MRVNPDSDSVSMEVPVEMPQGVSHTGISGAGVGFAAGSADALDFLCGDSRSFSLSTPAPSTRIVSRGRSQFKSASPPRTPSDRSASNASAKGFFGKAKEAFGGMLGQNQSASSPSASSTPDEFDLTLIDPAMIDEEEELYYLAPEGSNLQLQIISTTGLEQAAIEALTQHLQPLNLPYGFSGEVVFEFSVSKGRVGRIMLDEEASTSRLRSMLTLQESQVIELIKRAIASWQVPQSASGNVRLTLRIQT